MKKLFIILIIGICIIPIQAQQTRTNLDYLNSAMKRINFGRTFTLIGAGTMAGGAIFAANRFNALDNSSEPELEWDYFFQGLFGLVLVGVGEIMIDVGLPFWIVGGVRKARAERNLELGVVQFKSPNNHASVNGIGLKIRF
jgi:hypothetical protein